ncbi:MAG: phosphatase PAP2 family protein [Lachnospiraceae bacterium]|nr:phosphatase PAP2 family protein [Lachnospiraceae bacterium]
MKALLKKYSHAWTLLYVFIYGPWFILLENHVTTNYNVIHCALDDKIPFCEYFIIPYFLWFLFVPATMIYLFFYSKKEFYQASAFLFIGMTIFLIICTVWPNGINLRQDISYRDNIFADWVCGLRKADTSTNVFPSLHVFNTLGCQIALMKSKGLRDKKFILLKILAGILSILIILSTLFLRQHSVVDVLGAFGLAVIMYISVYIPHWGASKKETK